MKLSLDDETYAILREESDRLRMPVPRMIRIMCQDMAQNLKKRDAANDERLITGQPLPESLTNPQGMNNESKKN
ncbi:hypothetical protein B6J47_26865 [Klebsiella pneumoniae]|uniref:hypothetical protein n=1 Tax=Enterobacteriaceae TaxID=543 RepID=UPI00032EE66F|nr:MULTISPECIES: hypothetical protein [Klebsiella/Raoultella group]EJG2380218.1 hypothetical protein [Raoultella ornithinolytica]EOQ47710.1 hypothetical protein A1WC_04186 [Klebsiella sp. KTE92]MCJ1844710.1 hypothetical protein [Klebsiella quasipneumoniae subsp. similipneumoniae]MCJ5546984.1 hypothetical protein [Klebsiella quasipneumoniae]MDD9254481.1 hypothetical protein [Klebsiella variicola]